jgi:hypothetical protein
MIHEIDIYGVFLPDLLVWVIVAFFVNLVARRLLASLGLYRLVWHRALFDTALFVLILGGVVAASERYLS